jgi:Rrf2 family transcriptional regulator, repressor of oqxAB
VSILNEKTPSASSIRWFSLALQALLIMADNEGLCPSARLADKIGSESGFLRKILRNLVKEGLVQAKEGRDGGYFLAKAPEDIRLSDVYAGMRAEPFSKGFLDVSSKECFEPCTRSALSGLKNEMEQWILNGLEEKTLRDLMGKK